MPLTGHPPHALAIQSFLSKLQCSPTDLINLLGLLIQCSDFNTNVYGDEALCCEDMYTIKDTWNMKSSSNTHTHSQQTQQATSACQQIHKPSAATESSYSKVIKKGPCYTGFPRYLTGWYPISHLYNPFEFMSFYHFTGAWSSQQQSRNAHSGGPKWDLF